MKMTSCQAHLIPSLGIPQQGWLIKFPYNPEFLDDFKNNIPPDYREWQAATKTWFVDEECASTLSELFENWGTAPILLPIRLKSKKGCPLCNGKGFVPSKILGKFSGKPIAGCFSRCECQEDDHNYLPYLRREDFDFPCSYAWRSYYEEQATGKCLEPIEQVSPPAGKAPVLDKPEWERHRWAYIEQLAGQVRVLNSKVTELRAKKKKTDYY